MVIFLLFVYYSVETGHCFVFFICSFFYCFCLHRRQRRQLQTKGLKCYTTIVQSFGRLWQ